MATMITRKLIIVAYMYIVCLFIPIIFISFLKISSFFQVESSFLHSSLQFLQPFSFSYIPARVLILRIRMVVNSTAMFFNIFYGIGVRTQCPTPNLEDQDLSLFV